MANSNHAIVYRVDATSNLLPTLEPSVTLSPTQAQRLANARQRMGYDVYVQVSFAHWYLSKPEDGYWTCDRSCGGRKRTPEVVPAITATKRTHIPLAVRRVIFERDGYKCVECGADENLSIDHIIPFSQGGLETLDNLRTLCLSCNSARGNRPPSIPSARDRASTGDGRPEASD